MAAFKAITQAMEVQQEQRETLYQAILGSRVAVLTSTL